MFEDSKFCKDVLRIITVIAWVGPSFLSKAARLTLRLGSREGVVYPGLGSHPSQTPEHFFKSMNPSSRIDGTQGRTPNKSSTHHSTTGGRIQAKIHSHSLLKSHYDVYFS